MFIESAPEPPPEEGDGPVARWTLIAFRYVIPSVVVAFGLVYPALGLPEGEYAFGLFVGAGLSAALASFFFRVGVSGEAEREEEERAREFHEQHGYWPDEAPDARALNSKL